ncbi:MAG: phosphoglucosamine mutase [Anaerolineaceae bacterium]
MANPRYFGTDGIRGTAGTPPMSEDFVRSLGAAAARVLGGEKQSAPLFVIGRDTRISGPGLQAALTEGFLASGAQVLDLGVLPTPGIAFLTRKLGADAGVVISASHNPAPENGIKFLNAQGMKLPEEVELAIEALLGADPGSSLRAPRDGRHLREDYLQDLLASQPGLDLSGKTLLLDCANGAAYEVAPELFKRLGARVLALNTAPDGLNINERAGSEHLRADPSVFGSQVREAGADLGMAFDGDADRVIFVDENGRMVDGDHMLAILADFLLARGELLGETLVTTTMANGALAGYCTQKGIRLIETPVGDKYITGELLRLSLAQDAPGKLGLGGEQSGHIILLDENHRTGDGIRTALFMLRVLAESGWRPLSALTGQIGKYPQLIASCNVASKPELAQLPALNALLTELRQGLPGLVRLNLRYSGTEPKCRLMLETDTSHTPAQVAAYAWRVCELIQRETGTPAGAKIEVLNVSDGGLMPRPE